MRDQSMDIISMLSYRPWDKLNHKCKCLGPVLRQEEALVQGKLLTTRQIAFRWPRRAQAIFIYT